MTARTVSAAGATFHVLDEGQPDGPPIVLLHAGIADSRAWDEVVPLLAAAGYRVVRFDRRGFGRTVTEDVEFSNRADVIAILDALGIGRAVLVGNSQGGQIAFDTAIEFPDRVAAVVGVAAGLGGYWPASTPEEEAEFQRLETLEEALDAAGPDERPDLAAAFVDDEVRFWVDGLGQPADRVPAGIRDLVRTMDAAHYEADRVLGRPVPLQPMAAERLAELRAPVLAVAGALDVSDTIATVRHLEASLPAVRAVVLPDVAHMIGMERPGELAALVLDFVAPLPRWS